VLVERQDPQRRFRVRGRRRGADVGSPHRRCRRRRPPRRGESIAIRSPGAPAATTTASRVPRRGGGIAEVDAVVPPSTDAAAAPAAAVPTLVPIPARFSFSSPTYRGGRTVVVAIASVIAGEGGKAISERAGRRSSHCA
jgi:hypothetical protein